MAGAGHLHGASKRHLDGADGTACSWPDGAAGGVGVCGVLVVQHVLCGVLDFGTIAPYRLRLGVAATIALVCWLIFMVGTGFDVTAHGGISLFIGAPMVGMLGFSYLIELGERADVARASLALSEEREEIARDVHDVLGHS